MIFHGGLEFKYSFCEVLPYFSFCVLQNSLMNIVCSILSNWKVCMWNLFKTLNILLTFLYTHLMRIPKGGLACCDSWGHKELNMTEWLNWTELNEDSVFVFIFWINTWLFKVLLGYHVFHVDFSLLSYIFSFIF